MKKNIIKLIPIALVVIALVCGCTTVSKNDQRYAASTLAQPGLPPLSAITGTGTLMPPANPDNFTFVVFGDSQPNFTVVSQIFNQVKSVLKPTPDFALSLGDIVKGEPQVPFDSEPIEKTLKNYLSHAKEAGVPIFNAPGNHELDDVVNTNPWTEMPSQKMQTLYEKVVGPTYGSFDFGNSHFIVLNTEDVPPKGMKGPTPPMEFSYIGPKQLAELQADLDANRDKTHIFVAMHYPIHPLYPKRDSLYGESRQALIELFAKYSNISYVLASHEHYFYNPFDEANVSTVPVFRAGGPTRYLISGGAGAPFWDPSQIWAFHHYLVFEVSGDIVNVTIKRLRE